MLLEIKKKNYTVNWVAFFLAAVMLFIPISPTLKSVFISLSAGTILLMPAYRRHLSFIFFQHCSRAAIVLFAVAVLACFWSVASHSQQLSMVEKYAKLLYLPVLAVGFADRKTRMMTIHAFLVAMTIVCMLSLLKKGGIVTYHDPDPGRVFHNHIITGYMIAFASYLSGWLSLRSRGFKQRTYWLLALLFSYQMLFVNTGRTGYVVYFLLLLLLLFQHLSWKHLIFASLICCALFGVLVSKTNSALSTGVSHVIGEIYDYKQGNKSTSVGFRLQFHHYAKSLFMVNPWLGYGTGGFAAQFAADNPVPAWGKKLSDPHSQYWLVACEFGLLGLSALGYLFVSLIFMSFRLIEMRSILLAMLIPYFFANLSDALLFNSAAGYLFIVFSALCLGEYVENSKAATTFIRDGGTF